MRSTKYMQGSRESSNAIIEIGVLWKGTGASLHSRLQQPLGGAESPSASLSLQMWKLQLWSTSSFVIANQQWVMRTTFTICETWWFWRSWSLAPHTPRRLEAGVCAGKPCAPKSNTILVIPSVPFSSPPFKWGRDWRGWGVAMPQFVNLRVGNAMKKDKFLIQTVSVWIVIIQAQVVWTKQ